AETSTFHQLSDGNTGSGAGGGAPSTGTAGGHWASAAVAAKPRLIASITGEAFLRMTAGLPGSARRCPGDPPRSRSREICCWHRNVGAAPAQASRSIVLGLGTDAVGK